MSDGIHRRIPLRRLQETLDQRDLSSLNRAFRRCLRPALYILAVGACYLFYRLFVEASSRIGSTKAFLAPNNRIAKAANATGTRLQALLNETVEITNWAGMGDRVGLLTELVEAHMQHPSLDDNSLIRPLRHMFPWWYPATSSYIPWRKAISGADSLTTGIVMCVGSNNFLYAAHLIRTLREVLHSALPIQIAYGGDGDLPFNDRVALTSLGSDIETINLLDWYDESVAGLYPGTWAQKPFAMLASRFQRVIIVDADTVFMKAPDQLFESEQGLVETGTLFWHDMLLHNDFNEERHGWFKNLMKGRKPSPMLEESLFWKEDVWMEMESGVVCLDKGRPGVFMSLMFATWMNTKEVRDQVTYVHVHGDKETFWLSAELSGTDYHFNPEYAGKIGYLQDESDVCGVHLLHLDSERRPLWINFSLRSNKALPGRMLATFTHWMTGSQTTRLSWEYQGIDRVWCARGGLPMAINGTEFSETLQDMKNEVVKVDAMFPDR